MRVAPDGRDLDITLGGLVGLSAGIRNGMEGNGVFLAHWPSTVDRCGSYRCDIDVRNAPLAVMPYNKTSDSMAENTMNIKKSLIRFRQWERRHPTLGFILFILFSCTTVPIVFRTIFYLLWPNGF